MHWNGCKVAGDAGLRLAAAGPCGLEPARAPKCGNNVFDYRLLHGRLRFGLSAAGLSRENPMDDDKRKSAEGDKSAAARPDVKPEVAPDARPDIKRRPIVEVAPASRPDVKRGPIIEVAPEIGPDVRQSPEAIVEVGPEVRPDIRHGPIVDGCAARQARCQARTDCGGRASDPAGRAAKVRDHRRSCTGRASRCQEGSGGNCGSRARGQTRRQDFGRSRPGSSARHQAIS